MDAHHTFRDRNGDQCRALLALDFQRHGIPRNILWRSERNPIFSECELRLRGARQWNPGAPAFRPLVGADIPSINLATNGNGGVSGTLSIANGGTGQSTAAAAFNALAPSTTAGGLIYGTGTNSYGNLPLGTSGQCLQSNGTTLVWG